MVYFVDKNQAPHPTQCCSIFEESQQWSLFQETVLDTCKNINNGGRWIGLRIHVRYCWWKHFYLKYPKVLVNSVNILGESDHSRVSLNSHDATPAVTLQILGICEQLINIVSYTPYTLHASVLINVVYYSTVISNLSWHVLFQRRKKR